MFISCEAFLFSISIACQLCGSTILTFKCISFGRKDVIKMFIGKGLVEKETNTNEIIYDKNAFKETYRKMYLSKSSLLSITVGYALSIFDSARDTSRCIIFLMTAIFTVMLIFIISLLVNIKIKHLSSADINITSADLDSLGIKANLENTSNEEVDKICQ